MPPAAHRGTWPRGAAGCVPPREPGALSWTDCASFLFRPCLTLCVSFFCITPNTQRHFIISPMRSKKQNRPSLSTLCHCYYFLSLLLLAAELLEIKVMLPPKGLLDSLETLWSLSFSPSTPPSPLSPCQWCPPPGQILMEPGFSPWESEPGPSLASVAGAGSRCSVVCGRIDLCCPHCMVIHPFSSSSAPSPLFLRTPVVVDEGTLLQGGLVSVTAAKTQFPERVKPQYWG